MTDIQLKTLVFLMIAGLPIESKMFYHIMELVGKASWDILNGLVRLGLVSVTDAIPTNLYSITEKGKQCVKEHLSKM